jgi:hypothetical protein
MTKTEWEIAYIPAMAPEELPRDEGIRVFVHDSGYEVSLYGESADAILTYIDKHWGGEDRVWMQNLRASATEFPVTPTGPSDITRATTTLEKGVSI